MTKEEKMEYVAWKYSRICDEYRVMELVRRAFEEGARWAWKNEEKQESTS